MSNGRIMKALSGFYYVEDGTEIIRCRARGKFRKEGITPLVGDLVEYSRSGDEGIVDKILPRKNSFIRPPVANIDRLVIILSAVIPVTDPFLADRIIAIAEYNHCQPLLCINKSDLDPGDDLYAIYSRTGLPLIRVSAATGEGIPQLVQAIQTGVSAFTGNSGVGKSSILNAIQPNFGLEVGEVSTKLGRGRHTTRHVELYHLDCGATVADTPGFSAFDPEMMELTDAKAIQHCFSEFRPHIGSCRFLDCGHVKEQGCSVLEAVKRGEIPLSRHQSYVRMYEQAKKHNDWEDKK